jgi:hypothetical protein
MDFATNCIKPQAEIQSRCLVRMLIICAFKWTKDMFLIRLESILFSKSSVSFTGYVPHPNVCLKPWQITVEQVLLMLQPPSATRIPGNAGAFEYDSASVPALRLALASAVFPITDLTDFL